MEALKYEALGKGRVTLKSGYEFVLNDSSFLAGLNIVKSLTPVSFPLILKQSGKAKFFHLRRTRRDHFSFLYNAHSKGIPFAEPVLNVRDPETRRFYLLTSHGNVKPLVEFLASSATNKRKLNLLKEIAGELVKLGKTGLRHGDVVHSNIFVGKGDQVLLANPELDDEVIEHIPGDLEQFREMLFHLEKELDHEPAGLWEDVKTDAFFKNLN